MEAISPKIKEVGVEDFRTILEVQPRYGRIYDALWREYNTFQDLVEKEHWTRAEDKKRESLDKSISHKTASLLEEHLHTLGLFPGFDEEKNPYGKVSGNISYRKEYLGVNLPPLPIYPPRKAGMGTILDGYQREIHLYPQKERIFQGEIIFKEEGTYQMGYVSDALRLLFRNTSLF